MLTTKDIKIKEHPPGKVTMLTTNKVKPKGFETKGKPEPFTGTAITTSNVGEHLKKLRADERMTKARAARKKK